MELFERTSIILKCFILKLILLISIKQNYEQSSINELSWNLVNILCAHVFGYVSIIFPFIWKVVGETLLM